MPQRTSVDHFERLYRRSTDPWRFESSPYEQLRYQTLLSALGKPHYANAVEAGCSIGVLTALLAPRCDRLRAFDFAPSAVEVARHRCRTLPHVTVEVADLRSLEPGERFDLIIFSEVGYYFERAALELLAAKMADWLKVDGEFVAGHWLGHSEDHVLHGDDVHATLLEVLPLRPLRSARHESFRVDTWMR